MNLIDKKLAQFMILFLLAFITSCASSNKLYRHYEGDQKPKSEIATFTTSSIVNPPKVYAIDETMLPKSTTKIELLPGDHTIWIRFHYLGNSNTHLIIHQFDQQLDFKVGQDYIMTLSAHPGYDNNTNRKCMVGHYSIKDSTGATIITSSLPPPKQEFRNGKFYKWSQEK